MNQTSSAQVVSFGLDSISESVLTAAAKGRAIAQWENDLEKLMEMNATAAVRIIVCGPPPSGVALNEVAQFLRMTYPDTAIYYLTTNRTGFIRKDYIKNGFTDAFLLPLDSPTFTTTFQEMTARLDGSRVYRSVKLVDMQPGQALDFDTYIYLPTNKKHIRMTNPGDQLDAERIEKFQKHKVGNLHINADDMEKFYQWTAQQLKNLGQSNTLSATEKRDRMSGAVRELISDIFQDSSADQSFEKGKTVVKDCEEIVKAYILSSVSGADTNWYEKMIQLSQSDNTIYTMASNVATFSAMFSMALGIGNPENLAMAGLLHDIGISEIPAEIQSKFEINRTPEETATYQQHPKISVHLIQTRKMVIPEIVLKIVAQHHERYDGNGYPDKLRGTKIRPEAQILALADELVSMITPREGVPPMSPLQAIQKIYDDIPVGEEGHKYDPAIVRRLYELFKPKT
ncbi:HD domain-containing phosphohydrolase [Bdellovibrionota bacterium FG-1]